MNDAHFLTNLAPHEELLRRVNLSGKDVLEIGVGHGELTRLILANNPKSVVGYELEPGLCKFKDFRFTLIEEDFTQARLLPYAGYCLICNPPYSLLPFIRDFIIEMNITDVIIMTSPKYRHLFREYHLWDVLQGTDFTPPSEGNHLILIDGFDK